MRSQITKVALFALSALIINSVSAQSLFNLVDETIYADGFAAGPGAWDLEMKLNRTLGRLELTRAESTTRINPNNTFDPEENALFIEYLAVGTESFFIVLPVEQTDPTVQVGIGEFGRAFDPRYQGDWLITYGNDFPDDDLVFGPDGSVSVAAFPGAATVSKAPL